MDKIFCWWINIDFKTRIASIVISIVSIVMSGIAFDTVYNFQCALIDTDSLFSKDLGILLTVYVSLFMQNHDSSDLKNLVEQLYLSTSSICHIALFNTEGNLLFSSPVNTLLLQSNTGAADGISSLSCNNSFFLIYRP